MSDEYERQETNAMSADLALIQNEYDKAYAATTIGGARIKEIRFTVPRKTSHRSLKLFKTSKPGYTVDVKHQDFWDNEADIHYDDIEITVYRAL